MSSSTHEASEILVVLLEQHPTLWTQKQTQELHANPLQQILTFLNCFVLLSSTNELALSLDIISALIYQQEASNSDQNGSFLMGNEILLSLHRLTSALSEHSHKEPCLSAALSRALCFINSRQKTSLKEGNENKKGRILIINISQDFPGQYISFMNSVFAAQHSSVMIDTLHLSEEESSFLQQASHLTSGLYLKVKSPEWLLQYLTTYFASGEATRKYLIMENGESVNFAASCFCHEDSIQLGFVCSVCLSVYCCYQKVCLTCGTVFESST